MQANRKNTIKQIAIDHAEDLFRVIMGEPTDTRTREWRKGRKGSFSMVMRGAKRGVWTDHESGQGGDILAFIAIHDMGLTNASANFPAVLDRAEALLGLSPFDEIDTAELERRRKMREVAQKAEDARETQRKAKVIKVRQNGAQRVTGTMAETYLRERGITKQPPESFASYNGGYDPELVIWATDESGTVKGGQGIALFERDTRKKAFGNVGGFPARLPSDIADGPLIVAEGPETALAIWQETGCETWAVFGAGNFASAPIPTDRTVILAPDADTPDSPAGKAFLAACRQHAANGAQLYIAESGQQVGSKGDLNDTLQEQGSEAVRAAIEAATPWRDPDALPSAKQARVMLSEAVSGFHKVATGTMALTEFVAPLHILEASLGLGKTTTALAATVERIRHLREQGDDQGAAIVLVPMHRLSEQVKKDLQTIAPDLSVEILRGVEAQDPNAPDEPVCKQLDEYRKRQRLMIDLPCQTCPFADSCLFLKGKEAKADVYIQAHGALASKPAPLIKWRRQYLDHVVIDESPLSAMLFGTNGTSNISTAAWRSAKLPAHPDNAADLAAWRGKVEEAAQANNEGPFDAFWLDAVGLTPHLCREAAAIEWSRKVELSKDADKQTKRAQARLLEQNLSIRVTAGIWGAMAELLEGGKGIGGRLYVRSDSEKGLVIELQGVRAPHEGYTTAPILALDATADAAVAEAVLRREAARVDVIRAAEPMLRVRQDRTFSGSKALLLDSPTEKGKKACANNRRRLENFICRKARKLAPQRLLFIGNKDLVEMLDLPDNVVTAHFNALRGLNDFQDVAEAVIVGRPQPNETAVNRMASAIFDRHIDERINWKGYAERKTVNGPVMCKASMHPDVDAQRVLTLTRDAEVEQAIGRLRAVNRSAPVEVTLLSDAVVRQTVELAPIWAEQVRKADPLEEMLEDGGIAFLSPAHAAKAYPERWKTKQAAQYALGDLTGQKRSLVSLYDEFCPVVVSYRLPRAKVDVVAVLNGCRHPVPQASLERLFGPLAHFEVLETVPTPADRAVNEQIKRLESIAKAAGYVPKVTVRSVSTSVFVAGQVPAGVMASGLRRRGFEVMLE